MSARGYSLAVRTGQPPAGASPALHDGRKECAMQVVRADGFGTLTPLDGAAAPGLERSEAGPDRYPLVVAEWHDAWFDFEQSSLEDLRQAYLVRTVGFLVGEGPRFVSLAQEILPDGEGFRAVTHIPLAIVERLVRLDAWEGCEAR
jgi:hypothetical protein